MDQNFIVEFKFSHIWKIAHLLMYHQVDQVFYIYNFHLHDIRHTGVALTLQQVNRVWRRTGESHPNLQAISNDLGVSYGNLSM